MTETATVPGARCKTSLASAYGLAADSYPAFSLPLSPLLSTLLIDINSDLSKFMEDQTVHGFLPVPDRRQRSYYGTSTSSFPGPYTVPPGLTSITMEKASEVRKRSVSLSASQVSSLETMLSGMCEVASWLDWWLSTCGGYQDLLPVESRADFERLMMSGSRALEFLASQGCTALGNLVLSRRDALLADVRGTVPAEEVARLRYSPLPLSASFKNTKNLFIHIAHYPVRRFLRDIPTFLKCPLQSLVGAGVGSDRYQCDSAHETQPTRHCLLSRYRVWMCCSIALASTSPFAYFTYIS